MTESPSLLSHVSSIASKHRALKLSTFSSNINQHWNPRYIAKLWIKDTYQIAISKKEHLSKCTRTFLPELSTVLDCFGIPFGQSRKWVRNYIGNAITVVTIILPLIVPIAAFASIADVRNVCWNWYLRGTVRSCPLQVPSTEMIATEDLHDIFDPVSNLEKAIGTITWGASLLVIFDDSLTCQNKINNAAMIRSQLTYLAFQVYEQFNRQLPDIPVLFLPYSIFFFLPSLSFLSLFPFLNYESLLSCIGLLRIVFRPLCGSTSTLNPQIHAADCNEPLVYEFRGDRFWFIFFSFF